MFLCVRVLKSFYVSFVVFNYNVWTKKTWDLTKFFVQMSGMSAEAEARKKNKVCDTM